MWKGRNIYFRDGNYEPNKNYKKIKTIYTKDTWQLRRSVNGFYISTVNLMVRELLLDKVFHDSYWINIMYRGLLNYYKMKRKYNECYETMIFNKKNEIVFQIRHRFRYKAKKTHKILLESIKKNDLKNTIEKISFKNVEL